MLSGAAPEAHQRQAMAALEAHLVDREAGLLHLLDPPLAVAQPSAGYIQAYPPGVRENGGQYSHAGVWALMAQAERGDGDAAYRYFSYLSPAHRSRHAERGPAYAIEPYVMAGDVYGAPPYVGRGGWSWYTGSAAWMHRAAIESMFGFVQHGDEIEFRPCLPADWNEAEMVLSRDGKKLRVLFSRADDGLAGRGRRHAGAATRRTPALVDAAGRGHLPHRPRGCGRAGRRTEPSGRRLRRLTTRSRPFGPDAFPRPCPTAAHAGLRWGRREPLPTVAFIDHGHAAPRRGRGSQNGVREMLKWAVIFAVIALIAGALGFTGVAAGAAGIAKILFVVFLVLFVGVLLFALLGAKAVSGK